ncbi:hypothetical protein M409DRAFT_17854 [Zasmidium cellare ATCC 36951]|uniref:5-formyltetrahydrofolate cyclo-ligase n=1 Tax=Zasmidium cellare ATCC 36951 TaxID=1080233 RepID=A0A6A6CWP1_ZASCE|nr:uncharacterized protein M409DRAFT_17854 [Zasmidium cellare ATCC 36951]KAF2171617.1 hypothetical protein M409DRAFT_17854 [Zasmidium cellare ATCC 36951]
MASHGKSEAQEAKKVQRAAFKTRLSALSDDEVNVQSEKAQEVILSLPQFQQAKRVGIYLSMPTAEAQTDRLVRHALENDKKVFVPYIYPVGNEKAKKKIMDMLRLESIKDYESLERDSWGIPKLPKEGREVRENAMGGVGLSLSSEGAHKEGIELAGLDLIVVPAVAFDRDMNRMGHGAGFYDHYLSRFCSGGKRTKPFLVGLCLAEQIIGPGQLIMQEWDWKVDAVAVGDGSLLTSEDTQ